MKIVRGGGFQFLTDDPFLIAAVNRCAWLDERANRLAAENATMRADLRALHNSKNYRSLRNDIRSIYNIVGRRQP